MNGGAGRDLGAELFQTLPCFWGELLLARLEDGRFEIRHRADAGLSTLETASDPEAATALALYDAGGKYRPLKTAPNLRRGWRLELENEGAVRRALDCFYPGRVPAFLAYRNDALPVIPLRQALERQTGMYRVAARISEEEADDLVAEVCRSDGGCLRTILWSRDGAGTPASRKLPATKFDPAHDQTGGGEKALPLLCQEACNILVAAARERVKARG